MNGTVRQTDDEMGRCCSHDDVSCHMYNWEDGHNSCHSKHHIDTGNLKLADLRAAIRRSAF